MASIDVVSNRTLNTLIKNGRLNVDTSGWTMSSTVNAQIVDGDFLRITANTAATSGTYPNSQVFPSVKGNTAETRQTLYVAAKIRASATNSATSAPRVYLSYYVNGSSDISYADLPSQDGLVESELNDGEWHTLSDHFQTYNLRSGSYFEYYRIAFGTDLPAVGDTLDIKDVMVFNLTEAFGSGNEPNKAWCDANIVNFAETHIVPVNTPVEMITDRSSADVLRWKELQRKGFASMTAEERAEWLSPMKGSYNAEDLNRVETAVAYVAGRLQENGYYVAPVVKTTWTMRDIPSISDMNRYFGNVAALRAAFPVYDTTPDAPTTAKKLDYQMANDLERILLDVDDLLTKMAGAWFYSGDLYSGEV